MNLGSISNPMTADLRASYLLLEADSAGYRLQHRQVEYDREAVMLAVQQSQHPSRVYLTKLMLGQIRSEHAEMDGSASLAFRHERGHGAGST